MNILLYKEENFNANFYYHAKLDIDHAFFLLLNGQRILLVSKMNEALARKKFKGKVIVYKNPLEELKKLIKGKKIAVDGRSLPWYLARKLKRICKLEDASEWLGLKRIRKKPEEVRNIAKATKLTKKILSKLQLRVGMIETEVKRQLLSATLEQGLEPAFEPVVATAANARYPHHSSGTSKLRDMILIDYGVKYRRYCSDVARCFFLRKNKKMEQAYEKCQSISKELLDALPSLRTGTDVANRAKALMKKHGLPRQIHSIGHGIGLEVHEFPRLNTRHKDMIKGSVFALEPAAYFSNFGVRYENTIYFDGKKAKVL